MFYKKNGDKRDEVFQSTRKLKEILRKFTERKLDECHERKEKKNGSGFNLDLKDFSYQSQIPKSTRMNQHFLMQ